MGFVNGATYSKPLFSFISHFYGNPTTGGESYNFRLVETIQKQGYPLAIYTDDEIPSIFKKNYLLYNLWYLLRLYQFRNGILIIDSYMHPRLFIFLTLIKVLTKTKVLGTVHHLYWCIQANGIRRWLDKVVEGSFIARYDYLLVPSEYTLRSVKKIVRRVPKAYIIHPAVERYSRDMFPIQHQYVPGQQIKVLYVGGIQERKGVIFLVEALDKVTYTNVVLYLVGDQKKEPDYVQRVKAMIKDHRLQNKVLFFGRVERDELHGLYQEADIFVLPSFQEGYGIVVVEAMQFGLPIIASNVSSLPELVQNGVNGILVPPGDVEKIARAIDELSWSPEKRKMFADENLKSASKANTWGKVERQFLTVIDRIMARVK